MREVTNHWQQGRDRGQFGDPGGSKRGRCALRPLEGDCAQPVRSRAAAGRGLGWSSSPLRRGRGLEAGLGAGRLQWPLVM